MNLVFLPATAPLDTAYGRVPDRIVGFRDATIRTIRYPELVWYNQPVRDEAVEQVRALDLSAVVLVGFSKSGLGAWNIARTIPDRVAATIIFDAPMARQELPTWGTAPFYADDAAWQRDLPLNTVDDLHAAMPDSHQLVLITGPGFADEMRQVSGALTNAGHRHALLDGERFEHHWNAGWIEEGLKQLTRPAPR